MNSITSRVLQDISHGLPQKSLQLSTSRLHTTPSSRRFWSFFEFSVKERVSPGSEKIPLSKNTIPTSHVSTREVKTASESVVPLPMTPMASTLSLSSKPPCFSFNKLPQKSATKPSKTSLKTDSLLSVLDSSATSRNMKWNLQSYNTLRQENAGDFNFVPTASRSQNMEIIPRREELTKSAPGKTQMAQTACQTSGVSSVLDPDSLTMLTRSKTITKLNINAECQTSNHKELETKSASSRLQRVNSDIASQSRISEIQQLNPVISAPTKEPMLARYQRPSRLPIRVIKPTSTNFPKNVVEKVVDGARDATELRDQILEEAVRGNKSNSYHDKKKAREVPTTTRLQPHHGGSAASRSGTTSGQPLSGNSGDGGSRKPPSFPGLPMTSLESYGIARGSREKFAGNFTIARAHYSRNRSGSGCGNRRKDKTPKKTKSKEECKRYCCPGLDEFECVYDSEDCSKVGLTNDCKVTKRIRHSCSPPNGKKKCPPSSSSSKKRASCSPPTKKKSCSPKREPKVQKKECITHATEYKYQTCCSDDCGRDRERNYQVCCPSERKSSASSDNCKKEPKCPPPDNSCREFCTKPRNDECRPTKCPPQKNRCGDQRDYSQLATTRGDPFTGGRRHFSTLPSSHSGSSDMRIVDDRVFLRTFASDPCKPPSSKSSSCTPKKSKETDPCKPKDKPKQASACKPVVCEPSKKKKKPPAKCLSSDELGGKQKSKSDDYCAKKEKKQKKDPCKFGKPGMFATSKESVEDRRARELKEMTDCEEKEKNKAKEKSKDDCGKPKGTDARKTATGLERVISPCKLRQLKKAEGKKGSSMCKFESNHFPLPLDCLNDAGNILTKHVARAITLQRSFSTLMFRSHIMMRDRKEGDKPPIFTDDVLGDEEIPAPIPLEAEEDDDPPRNRPLNCIS